MSNSLLNVGDHLPGTHLIPAAIELFGRDPKLHHQIAGQIFRLDLAALLPPQPDQRFLISSHDDPGIGAADKRAPLGCFPHGIFHIFPPAGLNGPPAPLLLLNIPYGMKYIMY
jgi:hypothetical protein